MKEDLSACKNYLGIMLLPVPGKFLNRILLAYLKDAVDKKLWDNQAGLKREISCTDQIAILRMIIELLVSVKWHSPLYINFIDFEKAFDSLDRKSLWKLMERNGIPLKYITIFGNSYTEGMKCQLPFGWDTSKEFTVQIGVRQVCMLSLSFFF